MEKKEQIMRLEQINRLEAELDAPDMTSYRQMLIEEEIERLKKLP